MDPVLPQEHSWSMILIGSVLIPRGVNNLRLVRLSIFIPDNFLSQGGEQSLAGPVSFGALPRFSFMRKSIDRYTKHTLPLLNLLIL